MKKVLPVLTMLLLGVAPFAGLGQDKQPKDAPRQVKKVSVPIPKIGKMAHFTPRDTLRPKTQYRKAILPNRNAVPPTQLPVDGSGNRSCKMPMYANDQYGDCGMAMAAHTIGILSYGQGKRQEILFDDQTIIKQYLGVSGGDNGMDEDMEVGRNGVFTVGIGYRADSKAVSAMDVDPNDVQLVHYLLDQFYTLQLAWSVPNAFINNFQSGQSYLQPMTPNPNNGHYTTITDVDANGNYTNWTWGGYAICSQSMIASVQPSYFVVFCPIQFDPKTGYDSKGRHITQQAAVWVACGGSQIPQSVISAFPPAGPPPLSITSIDPNWGPPGTTATIKGNGFTSVSQVVLGTKNLTGALSDAGLNFTVPNDFPNGVYDVTVANNADKTTLPRGFTVGTTPPPPPPAPTTFTITIPAATIPGQTITFQGPLGRTYQGQTQAYTIPAQTVTGTVK